MNLIQHPLIKGYNSHKRNMSGITIPDSLESTHALYSNDDHKLNTDNIQQFIEEMRSVDEEYLT